MDFDGFWGLVEGSAVAASDQDERRAWLVSRLVLLPPGEIGDFAVRLDSARARVDTWAHWQAATLICSGLCGMDTFFYFQAWLVGLGRSTFSAVVASPDALADVPHVRLLASRGGVHAWADDEWPDWEGLDYVANEAYAEQFSGELAEVLAARGLEVLLSPEPAGAQWDFADPAEITARIPKLGALFGKVA